MGILLNVTHVSLLGNYVPFRFRNVLIRPLHAAKTILENLSPLNVQLLPPPLLIRIRIRIRITVTHVSIPENYVPFRSRNVPIRPLRVAKTILEIFPPLNVQLLPPALRSR